MQISNVISVLPQGLYVTAGFCWSWLFSLES